jgi:hypothetical protein
VLRPCWSRSGRVPRVCWLRLCDALAVTLGSHSRAPANTMQCAKVLVISSFSGMVVVTDAPDRTGQTCGADQSRPVTLTSKTRGLWKERQPFDAVPRSCRCRVCRIAFPSAFGSNEQTQHPCTRRRRMLLSKPEDRRADMAFGYMLYFP